ncbi:S1 family peptidase [Mycobacterium sherrisii]|uniref:Trypsin n=1 Tax=Mycobacterium sherrisii TaxID=243061 RepID=A0A1E3SRD3_9MYCO|nr:S1 family peptidase [Mycobacterium sherrisii]MCV7028436.1 trypsin [Mycobacterium sherrisii]MEC4764092.1 S1 family peptidase [Mycobacterium sherrisii]ODR04704.1 trypsin [Mycobacterium sherrisii]ORW76247.1 trypsin [Mycobacterium sherrisii]
MPGRGRSALAVAGVAVLGATALAGTAQAVEPPAPGIQVSDGITKCTTGFAAQGGDGGYYLFTSGHCDHGAPFTYADNVPLGTVTSSEEEGDRHDAAIIRLDPGAGPPVGDVAGQRVQGVASASQIKPGTPFCKLGAITGETCGAVQSIDGEVVEVHVFAQPGDSGGPGYVKNADGSVTAAGLVMSTSLAGDPNTTYFVMVQPLLDRWGVHILA